MADTKVSDLTAATAVSTDDVLYVVDAPGTVPTSKKITVDNFQKSLTVLGSTSGVSTQGNIKIPAGYVFYFGDENTNGSWRQYVSGAALIVEARVGGSWVEINRWEV